MTGAATIDDLSLFGLLRLPISRRNRERRAPDTDNRRQLPVGFKTVRRTRAKEVA